MTTERDTHAQNINQACEILRDTHDGDDLSPPELYLIQTVVNDHQSKAGQIAFDDLYKRVQEGYKTPWFHDIENLTIDHAGYVSWKGTPIEHFNFPFAYSAEGKEAATEAARRCRILEARGEKPTTTNVAWTWKED